MANSHGGFTLIEVIFAVMVLSVGVLGLVSSSGLATRMIVQGQRYSEAAALASRRLEILRAGSCPSPGTGWEAVSPFQLTWTVEPDVRGRARRVAVEVAWPVGTGQRAHRLRATIVCGP